MNDSEKINYITNTFHQYYDITLDKDIQTTETVNLVIPINELSKESLTKNFTHDKTYDNNYDITEILKKYNDTNYKKEITCFFKRAKDGDTIVVSIPYEYSNEDKEISLGYKEETVRLVGVNTPEKGERGANVSKEFLEKALSIDSKIFLKIDNSRKRDNYGRLLAVVISHNKNINEILLKEGLAEIWYIPPSEFNPSEWGTPNTPIHISNNYNDDISLLSSYFNANMTNIVFTPKDDYSTLYRYEIYNNVIFLKLKPYSINIRMHILPKAYDCDETILLFKDDMIKKRNISKSSDYYHYPNKDFINSYYQINGVDRNREEIIDKTYKLNDWPNTFCDFSYNISDLTKGINKLQICAGYRYNKTSPYYTVHYTGIRDNTNIQVEDRCTLIDANYDTIKSISNNITQYDYDENKTLYIPRAKRVIRAEYQENIDHVCLSEENCVFGKTNHKIIKYINDNIYSEETNGNEKFFTKCNWIDISEKRG